MDVEVILMNVEVILIDVEVILYEVLVISVIRNENRVINEHFTKIF